MFLDREISPGCRAILLTIICLIPALYVARQYSPQLGFTRLVYTGKFFIQTDLPQFQALHPFLDPGYGYDGQHYAQIALDPTLRDPKLVVALDAPDYRGRRILLPVLAWILGFGRPAAVVTVYALLNVAFWYWLLGLLLKFEPPKTVREWVCLSAILFSSGALYSMMRAVPDLPAATFAFLAANLTGWSRIVMLSLALLTKEMYAICAWAPLVHARREASRALRVVGQLCAILLPFVIWVFYVHYRFHGRIQGSGEDFNWPFFGWFYCIFHALIQAHFYRALAALSLLVQLTYLIVRRRPDSFYWRVAISFGIGALFLSADPFIGQVSFTRDLFPMTIGFNVLLMRDRAQFPAWFLAGNVGLLGGFVVMLEKIVSPEMPS